MTWRQVVRLVLPLLAFLFAVVSVALPSWYTQVIHKDVTPAQEYRTYGLFVWTTNIKNGSQPYNYNDYRFRWILACCILMVLTTVSFGTTFILLSLHYFMLRMCTKDPKHKRVLFATLVITILACIINLIVVCAMSARLAESESTDWQRAEFGPGFFTSIVSLLLGVLALVEQSLPLDENSQEDMEKAATIQAGIPYSYS